MSAFLQQIKKFSLSDFMAHMFVEIAENEMDERDCHKIHQKHNQKEKSCPLRKVGLLTPK